MAEADVSAPHVAIAGPAKIGLTLRSSRGPLARLQSLPLPVRRVAFANTGTTPIVVTQISIDPLQEEQHGVFTTGASLQVDPSGPMILALGTPLVVTLTGTVPAQPGRYLSTIRLHPEAGPPFAVPVSITVAANPAWGVALTLLGLSVVTLMAGLDEQGAVATKLRDALHKRGEAQAFVAHYPEPEGQADIPAMEHAYETAIAALSRPRSAGLLDHRLEDAAAPLAEADGLAASLREAAAKHSPSEAVVAIADTPWQALKVQLAMLAHPIASAVPGAGDTTAFAAQLDALLARFWDRLVGAPARWLDGEMTAQIMRLRLIAAAGELEDARTQARAMQTAIYRAAHSLAGGQRVVMRLGAQTAFLLGTVAEIQRGLADPDIPAVARAAIVSKLDDAQAVLSDGVEFRRLVDVARAVEAAETALARAAAQVETNRVAVAATSASAETNTLEVDRIVAAAQADPDKSPTSKAAHLRAIVDAWRSMIANASDAAARPALLTRAESVAAALERGDLPAVSASYRELSAAWAAYGVQRIADAGARALKPYCDAYAARLQRRLGFVDQALRWEEPNALSLQWDRQRDRLRLAIDRVAPDGNCLQALLTVDKDASVLTSEIGAAAADTAGIDAAVRLEALAIYGVSGVTGPRALELSTVPPTDGLFIDKPLKILIGNVDLDWRIGTPLVVRFGDDTPPLRTDAETMRRNPPEHTYTRPMTAHVTAVAADAFTPDDKAIGAVLGEGAATLLIAPTLDSKARTVADRFLSARFALALLVAFVVYSWRFQAQDRIFGARSLDYVEAFMLGFAVNAAIAGLPAVVAKLVTG